MKALLINGSPHKRGVTNLALETVAEGLAEGGCEAEIAWLGAKPISGCLACGRCREIGRCVVDDVVNELIPRAQEVDGIVIGSPTHYAAATGQVTSAMHRLFYTGAVDWSGKVGAAVVNCRRGGETAVFDQLNKYFTITNMVVVGSQYWNSVHGQLKGEAAQDAEGLQTMRTLGNNMAWVLANLKDGGHPLPEKEQGIKTNFIR